MSMLQGQAFQALRLSRLLAPPALISRLNTLPYLTLRYKMSLVSLARIYDVYDVGGKDTLGYLTKSNVYMSDPFTSTYLR